LEQHSQTDDTPRSRGILEGQLRESYGRVVYSHKTHEKCADILLAHLSRIRVTQIILSAITTAGFVGAVFGAGEISAVVGLIISTILLALNSYTKDYDLGELAQKHKTGRPCDEGETSRGVAGASGSTGRAPAYDLSRCPRDDGQAYRKAQTALQVNEDMTFTDDEIDAFLPAELKRGA
jgi:hypothetical protein